MAIKDTSKKTGYQPKEWEDKLYQLWLDSGFFNPDTALEKGAAKEEILPFSMVLPPPNATGTLHTGSACMLAIEDTFARFARMQGRPTLWLPGTDHAAIATQSKIERLLWEEEKKTRYDLGREALLARIDEFVEKNQGVMLNQMKKMGASLDWSRLAFTLDEERNRAVRAAFKQMYDDGIIYRGERIVNWDPIGQTTISDDEIVYQEETAEFYYFQYGPFVIGTARPETKFGDKYVVMHPGDERYHQYADGQKIELEWINGPITATVIKDEAIDPEFGTGVMTITPWHSTIDFEIAERHSLEKEQIIDTDGKLLAIAGEFAGLPISEAREKVVAKLKEKGLLVKRESPYVHQVATAERTGAVIEPQIMRQWFVGVNKEFSRDGKPVTLKKLMQEAVRGGAVNIIPERFEKIYFHWIDNLRDWCISRQIWYGHQIPVYYCLSCQKETVAAEKPSRIFLVRHGETDWNKQGLMQGSSDIPLNETGKEQAKNAGEKLKKENVDIIFSSDLKRAQETAQILADTILHKQEVRIDPRLRERHLGDMEGVTYEEIDTKFPQSYTYDDKTANNESFAEVESRVWEAVSDYLTEHPGKNIVLVGHGGSLRMLLRRIKNVLPEKFRALPRVKNADPLPFEVLSPCTRCGSHFYEQDPDTLDTWFSSGLWSFSTLGWGSDEAKWEREKMYHPTTLLETGHDILFFWVARMILFSTYLLGEVPFKNVYLHGLVRDEEGRKMSKSLDNIVDPLDVIKEYGTDALRLALTSGNTPGNDLRLGNEKLTAMRNFVNKVWNISRYVVLQEKSDNALELLTAADHFIVSRFTETRKRATDALERYNLSLAIEHLKDFTLNDFADWYVEIHKHEKNTSLLRKIFQELVTLWHPFIPFVTEAIQQEVFSKEKLLLVRNWPEENIFPPTDTSLVAAFEDGKELVKSIRNIRSTYNIAPSQELILEFSPAPALPLSSLLALAKTKEGSVSPEDQVVLNTGSLSALLSLKNVINVEVEKARLTKKFLEKSEYLQTLSAKLENKNFLASAPATVKDATEKLAAETKDELENIQTALNQLQ